MFYDAMIAKLITYGKDRDEAIKHMKSALGEYVIKGVSHNISFLEAVMNNERFVSGNLSTNFIAEEYPDGFSGADIDEGKSKIFLCVGLVAYLIDAYRAVSIEGQQRFRERQIGTRWVIGVNDSNFGVYVRRRSESLFEISQGGKKFLIDSNWNIGSSLFKAQIDGETIHADIEPIDGGYSLTHAGSRAMVTIRTPRVSELTKYMPEPDDSAADTQLLAPISGAVVDVRVKVGDNVLQGQELVVLEAMKMENILYAEKDAVIADINTKTGENVAVNDILITFEKQLEEA